jgi:hypothetical protein
LLPGLGCVAQLDAEAVIESQTTARTVHNLFALGVGLRSIVEELDHAERTYATHPGPEPVAAFGTQDQYQQRPSPRGAGAMRLNMQRVNTSGRCCPAGGEEGYRRGYVWYEYHTLVPAPPSPPNTPYRAPSSVS